MKHQGAPPEATVDLVPLVDFPVHRDQPLRTPERLFSARQGRALSPHLVQALPNIARGPHDHTGQWIRCHWDDRQFRFLRQKVGKPAKERSPSRQDGYRGP